MQTTDKVLAMLNKIEPMSKGLQEHLGSAVIYESFKKNKHLLEMGQVCRRIYFILEGWVRCYYIDEDGKEVCSWFMKEGDVITAIASFYGQKRTKEAIKTLKKTKVCSITFSQMRETCELYPEFYKHVLHLTEKYHILFDQEKRLLRMRKPAVERLRFMLKIFPDLLSCVPKKHIASYLGISHCELSRIKL